MTNTTKTTTIAAAAGTPARVFEVSYTCTAFMDAVVGTRVTDEEMFYALLTDALNEYDAMLDRAPGQHFIHLPPEATKYVSSGVGHTSDIADRYVPRAHRGRVTLFLKRQYAAEATGVAVVLYTAEAYLNDPQVKERGTVLDSSTTHVVVQPLAFAGPQSPLPAWRFVANLAGGNKEALAMDADEIRKVANEVVDYWSEWSVVAD